MRNWVTLEELPAPPPITAPMHAILIAMAALVALICYRWRDSTLLSMVFRRLQLLQLLAINFWFFYSHEGLHEFLPLYHCRIGQWSAVLPLPIAVKRFGALIGLAGSVATFIQPELYPFPILHLTQASFVFGHLFLLGNSLLYLLQNEGPRFGAIKIGALMLGLNMSLAAVNTAIGDGANYGYVMHAPVINSGNVLLNIVAVTLTTTLLMTAGEYAVEQLKKTRA